MIENNSFSRQFSIHVYFKIFQILILLFSNLAKNYSYILDQNMQQIVFKLHLRVNQAYLSTSTILFSDDTLQETKDVKNLSIYLQNRFVSNV